MIRKVARRRSLLVCLLALAGLVGADLAFVTAVAPVGDCQIVCVNGRDAHRLTLVMRSP